MASKTLFYEISEISVAKKPCSENNSQIKQVQTVLFGNHNLTRCKPQSYKCQIRNRPNLFLEKIKKSKKNFVKRQSGVGWCTIRGGVYPWRVASAIFNHATNGAMVTIPHPHPVRAKEGKISTYYVLSQKWENPKIVIFHILRNSAFYESY